MNGQYFMASMSRRNLLQSTGLGAAALACGRVAAAPVPTMERGDPLSEFSYGQVEFADGLHKAQLAQTHDIIMGLDEDSLLRPFRYRAGLAAPGCGGAPGCDLAGLYTLDQAVFGQWLSALSRYYAIAADQPTKEKVQRLVRGFAETVEPSGKALGPAGQSNAYQYDKFTCGLVDAARYVGDPNALPTLSRLTDGARLRMPDHVIDAFNDDEYIKANENYTLPENQFIAWQAGAGTRHFDIARQFLNERYFGALARGENVLAGRHAYSHVNALCSAAKAYLVLGDNRYLRAAENGLRFVEDQSFATGGFGPNEMFVPFEAQLLWDRPAIPSLADSLKLTHHHFETCCGSYAHSKLTRYLLRITKNASYGDSMERVMYNSVLGAKKLQPDGRAFYYSDYASDTEKRYNDGSGGVVAVSEWPCCSGTLTQMAADYRINTYFGDRDGLYVNLYIPSTLRFEFRGSRIALTQSGTYPVGDDVHFSITTDRPTFMNLRLRIPAWAQSASIFVNGRPARVRVIPGEFAAMAREWSSGDVVELHLARETVLNPIDAAHPNIAALVHGPLVLFALSSDMPVVTREQLLRVRQVAENKPSWVVQSDTGPIQFAPFFAIDREHYTTYLKVS
jgi:uncharacterized protein